MSSPCHLTVFGQSRGTFPPLKAAKKRNWRPARRAQDPAVLMPLRECFNRHTIRSLGAFGRFEVLLVFCDLLYGPW